ncbi:MAG: PAS domain S-box protein, partial [Salinivenus sp.]
GLDTSLCVYTLEKGDVLAIEDLAEDERFGDSPHVTDRGLRFYAGAPLITPDNRRLGTVCVFDTEPRSPTENTLDRLADLAAVVVDELELRRERVEHEQNRDLLRQAQVLAHVGGWQYDPRDDALTWTDQTYRIHDLPPDAEIDVETAFNFYTDASRPVIQEHVERLIEEGGSYDLELDIETAEGSRRRIRTIGRARRSDGQTTKVTGAIQDITESHQQKQALRESQERWQRLVDKHPGPIHISVDGTYAYANEATAELLGVDTVDDLIGRDMRTFIPPDEQSRLRDRAQTVYEEQNEVDLTESRIQRPDGTERIVLVRSVPIQYEGEAAAQTMMWDVTEHRTAERELRRSEKQLRTIVENAQPMTFMVDRNGTILLSEGQDLQSLGLEPGETVGESMYDRYEHHPEVIEVVHRALDGAYVDEELTVDDRVFDTWYSPFYDEKGDVAGVIGMAADITERKERERELRASYKRLRLALRAADAGTFEYEIATDRVRWDERTRDLFGLDLDSRVHEGALLEEIVLEDDRPRLNEAFERAAEERERFNVSFRIHRADDREVRHIRSHGIVLRNEAGTADRIIGVNQDVTERRRRKETLERQNDLFTKAQDIASVGAWEYDLRAGEAALSDEAYRIHGLAPDAEMTPDRSIEFYHPDDRPTIREAFTQAVEEGEPYDLELRLITDGGAQRWVRTRGEPQREDGNVVRVRGTVQDITEQKKSRERLERYHEHTDRLLNAVDDLFFAIDEEAQFQRWNARVPEVTGYSEKELEEITAFDLVPEDERERVAARIADAFGTGGAQVEVPLLQKDGTTTPYEFIGSLVEHPEGDRHLVGIGRDIADRKERERLLQQAETFFQRAQDALFLIDVHWDRDEPAFAVRRVNPAYESKTGLSNEEVRGASLQEILGPEAARRVETRYRRCVDRREPLEYEERIPFDGTMRYWTTRIAPVVVDGEVRQIVGTTRDVTERKRRREKLKEAKDTAEEADRIKSALLSNMNHEFRTPLTSIISFSELLSREPELAETFADRILGGGRRLLHTLNTVMDFAQLEAGSVSPTPIHVDVNSLVQSTVNTFSHLIDQDLSVQIHEPAGPLRASLDEHHVERVLTHLIHNAIKFTEEGTIEITLRETPDGVEVSVSDPGIGIDPEVLPRMFDEFAQASSGSDRTHEGNGIGLTIVKRLVARMDGDVTLHSTPGAGTEATVRLPNLE